MSLHGLDEYLMLAREIQAAHPAAKTIFLSTEDPDVIKAAQAVTDFNIVFTTFGDRLNKIVGGGNITFSNYATYNDTNILIIIL